MYIALHIIFRFILCDYSAHMPAHATFSKEFGHALSVFYGEKLHGPVNYYQATFSIEVFHCVLLRFFLYHSSQQVSFPQANCCSTLVKIKVESASLFFIHLSALNFRLKALQTIIDFTTTVTINFMSV